MSQQPSETSVHSGSTKHRDEIKRDKSIQGKGQLILDTIENVTTAIMCDPTFWIEPEFQLLRWLVKYVSLTPSVFPQSIHPCATYPIEPIESSIDIQLSRDFVKGDYKRQWLSVNDPDYAATLQITDISAKFRSVYLEALNTDDTSKQTIVHAVDGYLQTVTIKMSSQMNAYTGLLKLGSIIKLLKFTTIFFNYRKGT